MATTKPFLTFAILMVAGALIFNGNHVSAQCGGSIPALISQCSPYVQKTGPKTPPSAACCAVIKPFNIPCACKLVTKDIENLISPEKAVYVARTCGLKVPSGMKCGSYVVPRNA